MTDRDVAGTIDAEVRARAEERPATAGPATVVVAGPAPLHRPRAEYLSGAKADVVRELQALAAHGIRPCARGLLPHHADTVRRVRQHFRDFSAARDAAGLVIVEPTEPDHVLAELRALRDLDVPLTRTGLRAVAERWLLYDACRYFGSAKKAARLIHERGDALPAVDVTPTDAPAVAIVEGSVATPTMLSVRQRTRRKRSRRFRDVDGPEAVVRALHELHARGVPISSKRILREPGGNALIKRCYQHFSSFIAARAAAGVPIPEKKSQAVLPPEAIVPLLQRAAEEHGGFVPGLGYFPVLVRRSIVASFGTLRSACASHGLEVRRGNLKWTRERILDELRTWIAEGRPQTPSALVEERLDLWNAIVRHVGSFPQAFAIARGEVPWSERVRRAGTGDVPTVPGPRRSPHPSRRLIRAPRRSGAVRRERDVEVEIKRAFDALKRSLRRAAIAMVRAILAEIRGGPSRLLGK